MVENYELAKELETVNVHRRGGAALVEMNRPDSLNAWNKQFGEDLTDALRELADDPEVRAVGLVGAGKGFSSGADLKSFEGAKLTATGKPDVYHALQVTYHSPIRLVRNMPKPVVACVNGACVGIGMGFALAADLVVAKESAYFLQAFVNIGLVPDGGSSVFMPARLGKARSIELAMLGEKLPAPTALEWGLINRVYPDEQFEAEADALIERLATGPTKSYAGTKRQINNRVYAGMEDQLELEAQIQQEMANSGDFAEGVMAFLQKRSTEFKGA